jgi:hypothetical protein
MRNALVDLVLCVDCSASMRPCFDGLRRHLKTLLVPLHQTGFDLRLGLVGYAASRAGGSRVYEFTFVGSTGLTAFRKLYTDPPDADEFFTADASRWHQCWTSGRRRAMRPASWRWTLRRTFRTGPSVRRGEWWPCSPTRSLRPYGAACEAPRSDPQADAAAYSVVRCRTVQRSAGPVGLHGPLRNRRSLRGDGLSSVDFGKLRQQLARSITVSSVQAGVEKPWPRARYGQDRWVAADVHQLSGE